LKRRLLYGLGFVLLVLAGGAGIFSYLLLHRAPGAFFDSNGARIHYTVEGQGEPVILIHGLAAQADLNWRLPGITRVLARDFQVITFDLRGHGLSDAPVKPELYGIEMAEDIGRLMDHLGLKKAHMAGYSLGGFVLLKFMAMHPERVQSVAICAAGWQNPLDPRPLPSPYRPPMPPARLQELAAQAAVVAAPTQAPPPDTQAAVPQGLPKKKKTWFHRTRSWIGDQIMNPDAKRAMKKGFIQLAVTRDEIERNQAPALCVVGKGDGFYYLAKELVQYMGQIELSELEDFNHFTTPLSRQFREKLRAFFLKHSMVTGPTGPDARPETTLKVLTWNIQMLPEWRRIDSLNKRQNERVAWIVEFLKQQDADVLCLQEMFDKQAVRALMEGLRQTYPFIVPPQQGGNGWLLSNGVLFMSRIPIQYIGHCVFPEGKGIENLASKGCCLIEGRKDGLNFQLGGTHFPVGKQRYKDHAVAALGKPLLEKYRREGVPQLLAGDLNTAKGKPEFDALLAATGMASFPVDDPRPYTADPNNSWRDSDKLAQIDHVLLNANGTAATIRRQTILRPTRQEGDKAVDLADHYGVCAEVLLRRQ